MIAIQTKYLGPTNARGARIKAYTERSDGRGFEATISYPYQYSYEMAHFQAVKELVKKHGLDWNLERMRFGGTNQGYVFCFDCSYIEDEVTV